MKFLGFLIQWVSFFAAAGILFMFATANGDVSLIIVAILLFLVSGIGRRIFNITKEDIAENGFMSCIGKAIFCRRFLGSIVFYLGIGTMIFGLVSGLNNVGGIEGIIIILVGLVITGIGRGIVKYTCAYCGASLIVDAENYDNSITIKHTYNESTATQMSTQYCHCSVCGRRSRKRIKNNVGRIKYKYQ